MSVKITCIRKDNGNHENPFAVISSMNWINEDTLETGNSTREQIYEFVTKQGGNAYVRDVDGNKAALEGRTTREGTNYVKTLADDVKSDNLLWLPECQ